jgi:hypothetical protein
LLMLKRRVWRAFYSCRWLYDDVAAQTDARTFATFSQLSVEPPWLASLVECLVMRQYCNGLACHMAIWAWYKMMLRAWFSQGWKWQFITFKGCSELGSHKAVPCLQVLWRFLRDVHIQLRAVPMRYHVGRTVPLLIVKK